MKYLKVILILFCPFFLNGQNLIPNASFEDTATRVTPLFLPADWIAPTNEGFNFMTPLHNSINPNWSAPFNAYGYQLARTGNSYIGIKLDDFYTSYRRLRKEYLQLIVYA
jgi:hypothetical protein